MKRVLIWIWKHGVISTFLAGLFALLPVLITIGIMAWGAGLFREWAGPESTVGKALSQLGLNFVTNPTIASAIGWVAVLLLVWLLGVLLKSAGKKRIERTFHAAMTRIPLLNILYNPVAQVVEMLQRDPSDNLKGMKVVYCAIAGEGTAGFLGLLASDQLYRFHNQECQIVYVPTSPLPMSGLVVFAPADSVQTVEMQVDDLMKICFSIGVMSSTVIPEKYVVPVNDLETTSEGSLIAPIPPNQ
jgi:uncharacterized membrane protein